MSSPTKLIIQAYDENDFTGDAGSYTAQLNPSSYSINRTISHNTAGAIGAPASATKLKCVPPSTMQFELLFDGTGVIESADGLAFIVADELKKLEKVVFKFEGKIHSPRYLKIVWGSVKFKCVLSSLSINYKLFDINGTPMRATVNVSFTSSEPLDMTVAEVNPQSPDLLHVATVKAGDTLAQLTANVYGDFRYYLQVARYNSLVDFRNLKPGRQLKFPRLS